MKLIKTTEIGYPVMLGEAVGRIIGYDENGSWGNVNGIDLFSLPKMGTPHGTVIKTGLAHLREITPEGLEKLQEYEQELRNDLKPLYNGLINHMLPKDTETLEAKLRNNLTPLYGLSEMILGLTKYPEKKDALLAIIIETAETVQKNKELIDKLINLIEEKNKLEE